MLAAALGGCGSPPAVPAETRIEVRLDKVRDGDSIAVTAGRRKLELRLHGIDAPEYDQPWGRESRAALRRLLDTAPLHIVILDEDRYGRHIVHLYAGANGAPVAAAMLRGGHAWLYRRYEQRGDWSALELEARVARRGLWAAADPIPPWSWRQRRAARASGASGSPAEPQSRRAPNEIASSQRTAP